MQLDCPPSTSKTTNQAGNIFELIAHRDIEESGSQGHFRTDELIGRSKVGLVGDAGTMAGFLSEQWGFYDVGPRSMSALTWRSSDNKSAP